MEGLLNNQEKKMFQLYCGLNVCISMNPAHFLHPSPVCSPLGASIGARHCTSTQRRRKTSGAVANIYTNIYILYKLYHIHTYTVFFVYCEYAICQGSPIAAIGMSTGSTAVERFCTVQQAAIAFGCSPLHLGTASLKQPKKMISWHAVGFITKQ